MTWRTLARPPTKRTPPMVGGQCAEVAQLTQDLGPPASEDSLFTELGSRLILARRHIEHELGKLVRVTRTGGAPRHGAGLSRS